jgi:hypothetical protein
VETVRAHLLALGDTEVQKTYRTIAVATVNRLHQLGKLSNSVTKELLEVLQ